MNQSHIVKSHQIKIDKVSISDPKPNNNGGKSIYINYDKHPFIVQTPKMTLPYNMSAYERDGAPTKYSIELSFKDLETNPKVKKFFDNFDSLDKLLIDEGVKNSWTWLQKKKVHKDVITALFSPHMKLSKSKETGEADGKYPPTMKVKLPFWDNKASFKMFDFNNQELDRPMEELFVKGAQVQVLMKCSGIWVVGGKFGCSWNVSQVMVDAPVTIQNYSFIDDSDGDDDDDSDGDELIDSSDDEN
tara:strand:+ start:1674 stop:2408 length:735 start_codon:yes stop_codon:yes gene_type:complete